MLRRLVHVIDAVLLLGPVPPSEAPSTAPSATPSASFAPTQTPEDGVDSSTGFACSGTGGTPEFTFNRFPENYTYPALLPFDASDPESLCFLRLTDDVMGPRAVSAWLPLKFGDANVGMDFSMSIGYRIYGEADGSADGMAFVMHQDEKALEALGFEGGGIGYMTIRSALVVEWDTCMFVEGWCAVFWRFYSFLLFCPFRAHTQFPTLIWATRERTTFMSDRWTKMETLENLVKPAIWRFVPVKQALQLGACG